MSWSITTIPGGCAWAKARERLDTRWRPIGILLRSPWCPRTGRRFASLRPPWMAPSMWSGSSKGVRSLAGGRQTAPTVHLSMG